MEKIIEKLGDVSLILFLLGAASCLFAFAYKIIHSTF